MAGETRITGDTNILYVHDGSIYRPVACLTSNSLNAAVEVLEKVTKCDPGNVVKSSGAFSYDISMDGEYIDTTSVGAEVTKASHDYLLTVMQAKTLITWRLATGLADTANYYGTGRITDLGLDSPAGDDSTFTGTISGSGAIVTVDPIV